MPRGDLPEVLEHRGQLLTETEKHWETLFARRTARSGDDVTAILALAARDDVIAFSGGFPAVEAFPVDILRRLAQDVLAKAPALALQYSPTEGLPAARSSISDLLASTQQVEVPPRDVLVTSGGIEALQLLSRALIDPGDRVLVEAPTYLGAIMAFAGFEAQVDGVDIDVDGIRLDALEHALTHGRASKLLYLVPDHQNPSGLSLAAQRRAEVVKLCRRYGVLLVEDVAYRELGFDGSAPRSLYSLAPDVVVQIGTFSKIFMPGIRLGWAIGPKPVVAAMSSAKQNSDQCAGAFGQMLASGFLDGGHLPASMARARAIYEARASAMLRALEADMPKGVEWTRPRGGFFVWLTAPDGVDARVLAPKAAELGVAYVPGAPFFTDGRGANCFRLSFSRATEGDIGEGIQRLSTLLRPGSG